MRYVSTRGEAPVVGFPEVMVQGLAPDGGLYVPERWPAVPQVPGTYAEVLARMLSPYVAGSIPHSNVVELAGRATAAFPQPEVVPLKEVDESLFLLELFWGPTLAFKDLALQILAELFRYVGRPATVIGATSGDTGGATVQAFRGVPSVQVVILHPEGLVSEIQRRQMTTVDSPNIHNISVLGTFDDCQRLVKQLLRDDEVRSRTHVASANSINWLRIAAQTAYFAATGTRLGQAADFFIPTGNFGNAYSCHVAGRMGVTVGRITGVTNLNRGLVDLLEGGAMSVGPPVPTMSPAMDIQLPSNLERALFEAFRRDPAELRSAMERLQDGATLQLRGEPLSLLREWFGAASVDEQETAAHMAAFQRRHRWLVDPHTAVALAAAHRAGGARPRVVVATAHPAKFPDAVVRATGVVPALPERLAGLVDLPEQFDRVPPHYPTVRRMVLEWDRTAAG